MRIASRIAVLVAAAASTTACALVPGEDCPTTEVVKSDEKESQPAAACKIMADSTGWSAASTSCEDACGPGYNECFVHDLAWSTLVSETRQNDPSNPSACPNPKDKATVTVSCRVIEHTTKRSVGGCAVEGRRTEGLLPPMHLEDVSDVGRYFASSAHLESAAVLAFDRIVHELETIAAPADLVRAARVAREDEERHTTAMSSLAARFGARAEPASTDPWIARSILEMAIENEVEGCVREALGAAIATWRAGHAEDAAVREAMTAIAEDERAHAELSFRLSTFFRSRLGDDGCALLDRAREAAIAELHQTFVYEGNEPAPEVCRVVGAPRRSDLARLLAVLEVEIWSSPCFAEAA